MITVDSLRRLAMARLEPALATDPVRRFGRVLRAEGDMLYATGIAAPIGARCLVVGPDEVLRAGEVVGFASGCLKVLPEQGARGIQRGARIYVESAAPGLRVGPALLGRVLDAHGAPLDGLGPPALDSTWPLLGTAINPLHRARIDTKFDSGVRAVNALTTMGRGMRIGLFAGSGVGKTTLLGMMSRHACADIVVLGLIGERGREIREFIEDQLGPALPRSVVVAAPADATALARLHGAYRAAAIAEYFRSEGKHVLLVVDSLTRLAMAQREIGLAAGEPPAMRGYPASVFGVISAYVERAGNAAPPAGSITALYTVLVEGDDHVADPVADTARAVLDGHIVLSRALAEAAIYPPIDITASLSRPMPALVDATHLDHAQRFRALWARRAEKQDFIDLGVYAPGRDALLDEALQRAPAMAALLRQDIGTQVSLIDAAATLSAVMAAP
ncbi:MAG: FliI/YscN family ATPase [Acidocella sp.]|nr:FliI/YscN family ATPase [Acidocella sp.]